MVDRGEGLIFYSFLKHIMQKHFFSRENLLSWLRNPGSVFVSGVVVEKPCERM
jgi:hypothetical protein